MSEAETEAAFFALPSYCVMEWCRYKGVEGVVAPNFPATIKKGRVMLDLFYCMTTAMNEAVLATVPYVPEHFEPSAITTLMKTLEVKERPMLFSGPMIRTLLAGTKTQTRRIVKPQPIFDDESGHVFDGKNRESYKNDGLHRPWQEQFTQDWCPYGQPGDRLWVRETFGLAYPDGEDDYEDWFNTPENKIPKKRPKEWLWQYRADAHWGEGNDGLIWKPSIHMPRAASRLLLEITSVRIERLQDISEEDAIAEGIEKTENWGGNWVWYQDYLNESTQLLARESYQSLWRAINGLDSWAENPWVWVVTFAVVIP